MRHTAPLVLPGPARAVTFSSREVEILKIWFAWFETTLKRSVPVELALAALLAPLAAQAMDPRFRDANGDLVADPPTNPADFVDPPVLVFSYTPVEDPAVYA